jgi:hypothetical protein
MPTVPRHLNQQFLEPEKLSGVVLGDLITAVHRASEACEAALVTHNAFAIYLPRLIMLRVEDLDADGAQRAVAPLLLSPHLPSGEAARELSTRLRNALFTTCWSVEEKRNIRASVHSAEETDEMLAEIDNLDNYLVFRRVQNCKMVRRYPFISPPSDPVLQAYEHYIPEHIRLLLHAWCICANRHNAPYDTHHVGVDWAANGHLFINWKRFANSHLWPRWAQLRPTQIDALLRRGAGKLNLTPGFVPKKKKLPPSAPPIEQAILDRELAAFVALCEATDAYVHDPEDPDSSDACTVINPAYLRSKEYLYDGRWYADRSSTGQLKKSARPTPIVALDSDGKSGKAYPYLQEVRFCPANWIEDVMNQKPDCLWLPESYEETVWVHIRSGVPAVRPPRCLRRSNPDCNPEFKVWTLATDWMKLVDNFFKDGGFGNVARQSKSAYFKGIRDDYLTQIGRSLIEDFVSLDALPRTKADIARDGKDRGNVMTLRQLKQSVKHEHMKQHPAMPDGTRWYHDVVVAAAEKRLRIPEVARRLTIMVPELSPDPLENQFFFLPAATRLFEIVARASFGVLDEAYMDDFQMRHMLDFHAPAPVVLAWTRMCRAIAKGEFLAGRRNKTPKLWTPQEDLAIAMYYRTRPGRTSEEEWVKIESDTLRTRQACARRVSYLNNRLKKLLTWQQHHDLRVGAQDGNHANATRIVMLIGFFLACKKYNVRVKKSHPGLQRILNMDAARLTRMPLPPAYQNEYFYRFL